MLALEEPVSTSMDSLVVTKGFETVKIVVERILRGVEKER